MNYFKGSSHYVSGITAQEQLLVSSASHEIVVNILVALLVHKSRVESVTYNTLRSAYIP